MMTLSLAAAWHDLECGGYRADLPLWRRLAGRGPRAILEIGAGTGRVSLELARSGHSVTALDRDPDLLAVLAQRAQSAGLQVRQAIADARDFSLAEDFDLILVPMQTIQLLDRGERAEFLLRAADHLRPGGRLAAAITERFDLYDGATERSRLPEPDVQTLAGRLYISQATAVRREGEEVVLERRRESLGPRGTRLVEIHQERLAELSARQLEHEGSAAGLTASGRTQIAATSDHVGSVVVIFDA